MAEPLQMESYVRAPVDSVPSGVALAIKLLGRVPKDASEGVKKRARALRAKTVALQKAWADRDRVVKDVDKRPFDNANDVAWGALIDRLTAYAALPHERYPLAERASAILASLKLIDRGWLAIDFPEQWAEGNKRLTRVAAEGLRGELVDLAGEDFVAETERTHKAYGDALGITATKGPTHVEEADLSTHLRDTARAIADYAVQLLAMYDPDDRENDRAVRHALEPLDTHRAKTRRGASTADASPDEPPVNPDTPVPPTT
jgi:hypothetical protein